MTLELIIANAFVGLMFFYLAVNTRRNSIMGNLTGEQAKVEGLLSFAMILMGILFMGFTLSSARASITVNEAYYGALDGIDSLKTLLGSSLLIITVLWMLLFILFFFAYLFGYIRWAFESIFKMRKYKKRMK